MTENRKKPSPEGEKIYQFKIMLREIQPAIWRRIQVADCTLDALHDHIQTAMGWTNSHLYHFEIEGMRYGDPELLDDGFGEVDFENSRCLRLSQVFGKKKDGFRFDYVYDFGDNWEHDIVMEGRLEGNPQVTYPVCLDGARTCPPEDVGGTWGYDHLLDVLADPKHEEYDDLHEWAGDYDPESFSATDATRLMHEGLPDWRSLT